MKFDRGYFIGGERSNYVDYTQKDYTRLSEDIGDILYVNARDCTTILDYGCATGALVKKLISPKVQAIGTDISFWAIEYGRKNFRLSEDVLQHYNRSLLECKIFDTVLFLDVLEHMDIEELSYTLYLCSAKQIIVRVPVSHYDDGPYVFEVHERDETHIIRKTKTWWLQTLADKGYFSSQILNKPAIYETEGMLCRLLFKQ